MKHKSECCNDTIYGTLGDGVLIGWCTTCKEPVSRQNPRTGKLEWLDGESPWSGRDDLRAMENTTLKCIPTANNP